MKRTDQNKHRLSRLLSLLLVLTLVAGLLLLSGCANRTMPTKEEKVTVEGSGEEETLTVVDLDECKSEVDQRNFFDYIKIPFAYLLEWLYNFTSNYGLALILFALIVKILLFPTTALSKKSMMKMSRLTPRVKELEKQYADDKQKYQVEVNKLYKEEGAGGCGGCLWGLLPMLILIPLYQIIRAPITWLMFHGDVSQRTMGEIANIFVRAKVSGFDHKSFYWEVQAMPHIKDFLPELQAISEKITPMNTKFLGIELATIPKLQFWKNFDSGAWNAVGQFLLPLISGGINFFSMWISQKMNNTVIVNEKGEKDAEMAKKSSQQNMTMMFMMPLMSVYIGFVAPAGLSLYWIIQGIVSLVQDIFLTKHYKKVYDAEDAVKQAKAAEAAAREAELERVRAQKRAENPDGIEGSVSKKKQQQREKQEQAAKEAAYRAANAPVDAEEAPKPDWYDEARPHSRGRNYDPDRYKKNKDKQE